MEVDKRQLVPMVAVEVKLVLMVLVVAVPMDHKLVLVVLVVLVAPTVAHQVRIMVAPVEAHMEPKEAMDQAHHRHMVLHLGLEVLGMVQLVRQVVQINTPMLQHEGRVLSVVLGCQSPCISH
jgi:hypothetical protein